MRYPILRFISIIYGVLGIIITIGGFASAIALQNWLTTVGNDVMLAFAPDASFQQLSVLAYWYTVSLMPVALLIGGLTTGGGMLVLSGLIKLLLDIESNTRSTSLVLRRREQRMVAQQAEQPRDPARLDRLGEVPIREPVQKWQRPAVPRKIHMP